MISVCGRSLSHKLGGKSSATPASTLRKWALKFRIATSAAFCQWHPGGTSSMLSLHVSRMWVFMFSDTSLSSLAGNVLICHVFPSLHLQTCRVVSVTCLRSCRRHGNIACRLECLKDTTFDDMSGIPDISVIS